jgi:hypothetical protein
MDVKGVAGRTLSVCMHPHESEKLHGVDWFVAEAMESLSLWARRMCRGSAGRADAKLQARAAPQPPNRNAGTGGRGSQVGGAARCRRPSDQESMAEG